MQRALSHGLVALLTLLTATSCVIDGVAPNLDDQDIRLTILHTSDSHSRLLRYRFTPGQTDVTLGLDPALSDSEGIGGMDRLAYLVQRERARGQRVVHLDSGDGFQGAPIFNLWKGEPEYRLLSELGVDAAVIGNHEFDASAQAFADNVEAYARFPVLAANYLFEDYTHPAANTLARVVQPWTLINVKGLWVGVVGMGNLDSLNSITEQGNSLGIVPLETAYAAQMAVDQIRHIADVVIIVSHMGLDDDEYMATHVRGIDVIMGGHLHIVLNPPKVVKDPDGRDVIISHSGAFMKYLGRLDLVLRKPADPILAQEQGFEVVSHSYQLFPVDYTVDAELEKPDKAPYEIDAMRKTARVREILEPYRLQMAELLDLQRTVGCSTSNRLPRFGSASGDSPLGNIVAEAMQRHERVQSDFALTNSTGIRDDLRGRTLEPEDPRACVDGQGQPAYAIALEELYNVLPFENTITTMFLSGREVQELFDYVAARSASRGCSNQAQVSGVTVTLVCSADEHSDSPHADDIVIGGQSLNLDGTYELATNDYIANGGSGYEVLQRNTTQVNTYIPMRDAVVTYLGQAGLVPCDDDDAALPACPGDLTRVGVEDGRVHMRF